MSNMPADFSDEDLSDDVFKTPQKCKTEVGPQDVSHNCKFCNACFTQKKNCNRHEINCKLNAKKKQQKFPCPNCSKLFVRNCDLQRHVKTSSCKPETNPKDTYFKCKFCQIKIKDKYNCKQHERKCMANPEKIRPVFECDICKSKFPSKFNVRRHVRKCSVGKHKQSKRKIHCLIKNCTASFFFKTQLINHFKLYHQNEIPIKPEQTETFTSIENFCKWKEEEERRTFSYFTARSGQVSNSTKHFYCQHDGHAETHSKHKQQRKTSKRLDRIKVGHQCIAKMKVTVKENNSVDVVYYPTHNHRCIEDDQLHHPIPADMSKFIDKKLGKKIPPRIVFDLVKEKFLSIGNPDTRAENLTRGLIFERDRRRRMALRLHENDALSVFYLANQHIQEDNSILVYKPLGLGVVHGPEGINHLPESREKLFMFGFQTKNQLELMKKYCTKVLVVDETHSTNQYDYKLLSAMIIDENHRGWPVAHLITNKSDAETLKFFFEALGDRLGDLKHSIINTAMTDDDAALINSMTAGFSKSITHLLCIWHVIKKWKEKLRKRVPKDLFDQMLNELKAIMNAKDETEFLNLKKGFLNKYDGNSAVERFMTYLNKKYWHRAEKWALCYRNRLSTKVNTTGHLESFHNRLKTYYLRRKPNKRLDDLINLLYEIALDDERTRRRLAKKGFAVRPQDILKRHKKGLLLKDNVIMEEIHQNWLWEIKAGSNDGVYIIARQLEKCEDKTCLSKCKNVECFNLCAHLFECTCLDHHPICKHKHKLQSFLFRNEAHPPMEENFYTFETAQSSEICEEMNCEEMNCEEMNSGDIEMVRKTDHCDQKRQRDLLELDEHIAILQKFRALAQDRNEVSDHRVLHVKTTLSNLTSTLKLIEPEIAVPQMEPKIKFQPTELLKTQASQVSSFKRPPKRRRKENPSDRAAKKKNAIESLLMYAKDNAPDVDYVSDAGTICDVHNVDDVGNVCDFENVDGDVGNVCDFENVDGVEDVDDSENNDTNAEEDLRFLFNYYNFS